MESSWIWAWNEVGKASRTIFEFDQLPCEEQSVAYSPDRRILAAVSKSHELTFWDTSTWKGHRVFGAPLSVVRTLAFSADSKTLVVGSDDSTDVEPPGYGDFPIAPNVRIPVSHGGPNPLKLPPLMCD
jgi:WD40 repeat protein